MMNWSRGLKSRIRLNEPLKNKTTFNIGGPARFFCEPKNTSELKSLLSQAGLRKTPVFVLGLGSNVLVGDDGLDGLVVRLSSPFFRKVSCKGSCLQAGSGLPLAQLVKTATEAGLSGLESLAGIPGTVGGALSMNAGAGGSSIGDFVRKVKAMDYAGRIRILDKGSIRFGYRKSSLEKYIILNCSLELSRLRKEEIKEAVKKYFAYRRLTQDVSFPSAGCVFKNPAGDSAGRLIDLCGLKGHHQGGAFVSRRHANFILNKSRAKTEDVLSLMELIRGRVKKKFNVDLEPEIKIWRS